MVRGLKFSVFGLLMATLASCGTSTPTPTPQPSNTPLPPPPTAAIVTIDASSRQVPPTWTVEPTEPPAATSTRRPTSTPFAPATATETPGPFKGQLGVLTADNVISVALTRADLETELAAERGNALYSSIVSSPPKVDFVSRAIRLEVVLNNYTTEGLRSELDFALRPAGRRLRADITSYRTARGTLLTPTQTSAVREMLNNVLERLLGTQLTQANVPFEDPQVLTILVEETRVVVTARLKLIPTATIDPNLPTVDPNLPTAPPIIPTDVPTATEAVPTVEETATPTATEPPTVIPTLFPTVTPT